MSFSFRAQLLLTEDGGPVLRLGESLFRLADGGLIAFSTALPWQPEDSPASQFLEPEAPTEPQPEPSVSTAAPHPSSWNPRPRPSRSRSRRSARPPHRSR